MKNAVLKTGLLSISALTLCQIGLSDTIRLNHNQVVPVKFDRTVSLKDSQPGDEFTVTVIDNSVLPQGTQFLGHVAEAKKKQSDSDKATLGLQFDSVQLPDGSKQDISGVPVPMGTKYVTKEPDGTYQAKPSLSKDAQVGVGLAGGLLLGTILHKPFEGAFLGTLAGILFSATDKSDENITLKAGTEAGVFISKDVEINDQGGTQAQQIVDPINDPSKPIQVSAGEIPLTYNHDKPYRDGQTVMVPLTDTLHQLNSRMDIDGDNLYIWRGDTMIKLIVGSDKARVDGDNLPLSHTIDRKGDVIYVPAEFIHYVTKQDVYVNGNKVIVSA